MNWNPKLVKTWLVNFSFNYQYISQNKAFFCTWSVYIPGGSEWIFSVSKVPGSEVGVAGKPRLWDARVKPMLFKAEPWPTNEMYILTIVFSVYVVYY